MYTGSWLYHIIGIVLILNGKRSTDIDSQKVDTPNKTTDSSWPHAKLGLTIHMKKRCHGQNDHPSPSSTSLLLRRVLPMDSIVLWVGFRLEINCGKLSERDLHNSLFWICVCASDWDGWIVGISEKIHWKLFW